MDNRIRFVFLALAFFSLFACKSPISRQTVPGIPQNLVIDTDTNGNATLSWAAVSDADSYTVYYSADNSTYAAHASTSGTSRLVPFYGWYKVSAENEAGEGTASAGIERETPTGDVAATPTFTPEAGTFTDDLDHGIVISCGTAGSTIYYTLDGTTPVVGGSSIYPDVPITVERGSTVTITAIAALTGYGNSDAARGVFHVVGWQLVGEAEFSAGAVSYVNIEVDGEGNPCVAFRDASTTKATAMRFNGSSWYTLGGGGLSAGAASYVAMAMDSADSVYVAYTDASASGKATVRKYGGSSWATLGAAGFSTDTAIFLSIAVRSDGSTHTPYVSYQDNAYDECKATVKSFSGTSWGTLGTERFSAEIVYGTSLAVSSDGTPYLAFMDVNTTANVMRYETGAWSGVGTTGFSSDSNESLSFALAGGTTPCLAYIDSDTKATVATYESEAWSDLGAAGFSAGTADFISLAITGSGTPFVAYRDNGAAASGKATVMKHDGSGWVAVGPAGFSPAAVYHLDLALDEDGNPFVVFAALGGGATVMVYR